MDQVKKAFARQRAKDLAEHAKHALAKDKEIENLQQKCRELANQLITTGANNTLQVKITD